MVNSMLVTPPGEMAEWLKAHAWKACLEETLTWVRIPLSPPVLNSLYFNSLQIQVADCAKSVLACLP